MKLPTLTTNFVLFSSRSQKCDQLSFIHDFVCFGPRVAMLVLQMVEEGISNGFDFALTVETNC